MRKIFFILFSLYSIISWSQCANPNPYPFYPYAAAPTCYNNIGNADNYAVFNQLDSILYNVSGGSVFVATTGCPALPNPYYPWDRNCYSTIGNNDMYAIWYVCHLIDSVITAGGGGSGTVKSVSVVTANGVSGTVASPTVNPAITLSVTPGAVFPTVLTTTVTGTDTVAFKRTGTGAFVKSSYNNFFNIIGSWSPAITDSYQLTAGSSGNLFTDLYQNSSGNLFRTTSGRYKITSTNKFYVTSDTASFQGTKIQFVNGASANKVWTSDASGYGTWAVPSGASSVAITDDNSTPALGYQLWSPSNSGNQGLKVSSNLSRFNPATSQYTFGTPSTTVTVCDVGGGGCTTVDVTGHFINNQDAASRWFFGNTNTGTSAAAALFVYSDIGHGEYGGFLSASTTNVSLGWNPGTLVCESGSGYENGMIYYSDNGRLRFGTTPTSVAGDNIVVGSYTATCSSCVGIGTSSNPAASLEIAKAGTVNYAPFKLPTSGTTFHATPTLGEIECGTVGLVVQNGSLVLGATSKIGTENLSVQSSLNGTSGIYIKNTSSGNSAFPALTISNNNSKYAQFSVSGTGYTPVGAFLADQASFDCSTTNGVGFFCEANAPIKFYTNGFTSAELRWQITGAGHLLAGTTNSWDIGAANGATCARTIYAGTSMVSPAATFSASISMGAATFTNGVATGIELHAISTPTTAATITLTKNKFTAINPAGTIAALTITFPSSPNDNDFIEVKFEQIITSVTYVAGTGGATILGQINGALGGYDKWVYDSGTNTWY